MADLRLGVVGAGVFGSYHAAKVVALPGASLAGVYDPEERRANELATRFATHAFPTLDAVFARCDGVIIASPAITHYDLVAMALDAGKHVFVEKPLATTADAANDLVERAARNGLILQVGHQERYVCEDLGLFDRKASPQRIECVRHTPLSERCLDVSAVMDLMVHDIDIVRKLTAGKILNINASGGYHSVTAELFLDDGTVVTFSARRGDNKPDRRITLNYPDGLVEFDFIRRSLRDATKQSNANTVVSNTKEPKLKDPLAFGAELFANSIRENVIFGVSGAEAATAIEWAEAIEAAANIQNDGGVVSRRRVG